MDVKQLYYFKTIVEHQSISKAAEQLHLAQPALTRQLKQLEAELNVSLVERTTRHFVVTAAGKQLVYRAEQILNLMDTVYQEMAAIQSGKSGVIKIGTIGSEMEILLPDLIAAFYKSYPQVSFQCNEGSSIEVIERLDHGLIDLGIVRSPVDAVNYHQMYFERHPMVAAKTGSSNWNNREKVLKWIDLKEEKLIVLNRYAQLIKTACLEAGFEPQFVASVEDTRSLLLLASTGIGTAIVQEDWLQMVPTPFVSKAIQAESLETQTLVLWPKNRTIPAIALKFIKSIANHQIGEVNHN